LLRFRR